MMGRWDIIIREYLVPGKQLTQKENEPIQLKISNYCCMYRLVYKAIYWNDETLSSIVSIG